MARELLDPIILKEFRKLIKDMILQETKNLSFDKKVQAVVVEEPTQDARTCSVVLNHNLTTLPSSPQIIPNVPIRSGLNVHYGNEVLLNKVNNSGSYFVDYNKYTQATDLITQHRMLISNTSINIHDNIIFANANSGNITITLPSSSACRNKIYVFIRLDATASAVTIKGVNSETINGATSITVGNLSSTSSRIWLYSDGTAFYIINKN